ncbi:MAG: acylglycerol kinase family protein [Flavobacteriales bacterium]
MDPHGTEPTVAGNGADRVLCAGGDGTLNAVACGLLGSDVPLGIVPEGSGNGYSSLGLPQEPAEALSAWPYRRSGAWTGYLNDWPFPGHRRHRLRRPGGPPVRRRRSAASGSTSASS